MSFGARVSVRSGAGQSHPGASPVVITQTRSVPVAITAPSRLGRTAAHVAFGHEPNGGASGIETTLGGLHQPSVSPVSEAKENPHVPALIDERRAIGLRVDNGHEIGTQVGPPPSKVQASAASWMVAAPGCPSTWSKLLDSASPSHSMTRSTIDGAGASWRGTGVGDGAAVDSTAPVPGSVDARSGSDPQAARRAAAKSTRGGLMSLES